MYFMKEMLDQAVEEKIGRARWLYAQLGQELSSDTEIRTLLDNYLEAIGKTGAAMRRNGVVKGCTACAAQPHGSCCFSGIEEGFDHMLLLINMLLGRELPDEKGLPGSCYFVGEYGCKLIAKSYFCLHYLCPELKAMLGSAGCRDLLRIVGEELSAGWELEQTLRCWIQRRENASISRYQAEDLKISIP